MKRLFLLIPALVLAFAVNAAPIGPNDANTIVINALYTAVNAAAENAVIELSDGIYQEGNVIDLNKNITIKAADGAHPVIAQIYYFKLLNNAQVTFQGIKFDGGLYPEHDGGKHANDHCLRAYDNSPTGTLTLENCEFTRFPSYIIYTQTDARRWDAITIRNCYFHHNTKSAVFITYSGEHQTCNSLTIENSTFADFTGNDYAVIYYGAPDAEHTTTLSMNHCTFYNNLKQAIEWKKSTNSTISNCIFAQPSYIDYKSIECAGGAITKCLSYNSKGYSSAATPSGNLTGNPYFVNTNADNYDFSVASFSPAHNAGTDSKNLGDLRWTSDDSAHPTTLNITAGTGAIKAAVEAAWPDDEIVLATGTYNESAVIALNKDITIKAADSATPTVVPVKGFAISDGADVTIQNIKFNATSITDNLIYANDATAGNKLTLEGCELCNTGSHIAINAGGSTHLDACVINSSYFHDGNNSAIYIAQGSTSHVCEKVEIKNSTFANYTGFCNGLVEVFAKDGNFATDPEDDVEFSIDHCTFYNYIKTADNTYGFVDVRKSTKTTVSNCIFMNPSIPDGSYNAYATYTYGGTVTNCIYHETRGNRVSPTSSSTSDPLFTDAANGNFTLKRNYVTGEISPAYGAGTDGTTIGDPRWETDGTYPETDFAAPDYVFTAAKAKLTAGTTILETNESAPTHPYIRYTHSSPTGNAEWVIKATRACYVQAIVNMADNTWTTDPSDADMFKNHKHIFVVEVRNANETLIGSVKECDYEEDGSSDGIATYPTVNLPGNIFIPEAGVYTVTLRNPRNYSRCGVASITLSYAGGDIVDIPVASLPFEDAILSARATRTLSPAEIHFGSPNAAEYVQWNINASTGMYDITVNFTGTNHGIYKLDITRNSSSIFSESQGKGGSGSVTFSDVFIPSDGNYVLQLANTNPGADGYLTSVSVTASSTDDIFVIDEEETDGSVIAAKDDGNKWKPLLKRSFTPGMFNTICVPFDSYDSELVKIFGTGYQLLGLVSATITDGVLDLNFETIAGNDFAAGVPYLIKPTKEVSNPKFGQHDIHNRTSNNIKTCGVVQFIGSFVATELDPDPNNLFLAANDKLYFPMNNAMPILGTRAYFKVSPGASSAPIRQARIVQQGNVVTVIDLVNGELPAEFGTINKVIENGQLLIIRDGVQYNALGVRIK